MEKTDKRKSYISGSHDKIYHSMYTTVYCNHIVGLASRHISEKVTKAPCWLHLHGPQWGRIISHGCILAIH